MTCRAVGEILLEIRDDSAGGVETAGSAVVVPGDAGHAVGGDILTIT